MDWATPRSHEAKWFSTHLCCFTRRPAWFVFVEPEAHTPRRVVGVIVAVCRIRPLPERKRKRAGFSQLWNWQITLAPRSALIFVMGVKIRIAIIRAMA